MSWLKNMMVDIIVTLAIIIAVFIDNSILTGIIKGYTILMFLAKLVVSFSDSFAPMVKKASKGTPDWPSHLLYAINIAFLILGAWWYTAMGWVVIWALSWYAQFKANKKTTGA